MTRTTAAEIVTAALSENPGQTAQELGVSGVTMIRLRDAGLVEAATTRKSGGRGRPANVWVLVGQEIDTEAENRQNIVNAEARVNAWRTYERMSAAILRASDEFGYHSPERAEAIAYRKDAFPVPPLVPATHDYELIGQAFAVEDDLVAA